MELGYTILYVDDVPATLAAWEAAFGLRRRMLHDSGLYAELETGDTTLSFANRDFGRGHFEDASICEMFDGQPKLFEIGLVTPDVEGAYQRAVTAGMQAAAQPDTKPWGQTVAWVRDANGILVELATPME